MNEYKNVSLGLEKIAQLSQFGDHELRIELMDWTGNKRDANYGYFKVNNGTDKFRLHVADFKGSAGESIIFCVIYFI